MALILSLLAHGLLACTFFFPGRDPSTTQNGIISLELAYGPSQQKSESEVIQSLPVPKRQKEKKEKLAKEISPKLTAISNQSSSNSELNSKPWVPGESSQLGPQITKWPKILREQKAIYPEAAKAQSIAGTVTLQLRIDEQGNPQDVRVLSGPGFGLNEAALEALKGFRFSPALADRLPTSVVIRYKYNFKIE